MYYYIKGETMKNKLKAFTLAEVLITLTILGVIAAITLPALKGVADKIAWAKGLAVNSNIIKDGFERMLAHNEADTLDLTPLWTRAYENDELADKLKDELKKYFVFEKFETQDEDPYTVLEYNGTTFNNISGYKLYMSNGAIINFDHKNIVTKENCETIKENGGHLCESAAYIIVDVNGKQGPNTLGKDIFGFYLGKDANLYPDGGKDVYLYEGEEEESSIPQWDTKDGCQGKIPVNGLSCTARVVEEGYRINY